MLKHWRMSACVLVLFSGQPATGAPATSPSPEEMVRSAYARIAQDKWAGADDPAEVGLAPKKLTARWFTKKFIAALRKDAKCWESGKEGVGSVWYAGQDHGISDLKIEKTGDASGMQ